MRKKENIFEGIIFLIDGTLLFMPIKGSLYKLNVLLFSTNILREIVSQFLACLHFFLEKKWQKNYSLVSRRPVGGLSGE
jgi:hypothetical protein